jgi:uncharacterized membrane protein YbhN (UPF0104 family)
LSGRFHARGWTVAARFIVSAAVLWVVSRRIDAPDVMARLSGLEARWVAVGLVISVLQVATLAWRWRFTLARLGVELSYGAALGEYYLGILLNQILPGGVTGDVSRAWRHARTDAPTGPAVRAVVLERASAQAVMTLVGVVSILWLPWGPAGARAFLASLLALLVVLGVRALDASAGTDSVAGRLRADARRALLSREALPAQLATALLVVASYIAVFLVSAKALGTDVRLTTLLPLTAPVLMTMLVPVTVAGWGIREAAAAALWGLTGLAPEEGAAVSVTYGLLVLVSSFPGALLLIRALSGGRDRRARPPRA